MSEDTLENKIVEEDLIRWIMARVREGVSEEEVRGLVHDLDHTLTLQEAINRIENPPCVEEPNCVEAKIYALLDLDKLYSEWAEEIEKASKVISEVKSSKEPEGKRESLSYEEAWNLFCETLSTYGMDCEDYRESFDTLWKTSSKTNIRNAIQNLAFVLSVYHKKPKKSEGEMEKWFDVFCQLATANGISCEEHRRRFEDEWKMQMYRMNDEQRRAYLEELVRELARTARPPSGGGGVILGRNVVREYARQVLLNGQDDLPSTVLEQVVSEIRITGKALMKQNMGSVMRYMVGYFLDKYAEDLALEGFKLLYDILNDIDAMTELYHEFYKMARIIANIAVPDDWTKKENGKEMGEWLICAIGYGIGKVFEVNEIISEFEECYKKFISMYG
ncbi:MAG: hypothetical protein ACP5LW_05775 [Nitrososphaeria archaeon]